MFYSKTSLWWHSEFAVAGQVDTSLQYKFTVIKWKIMIHLMYNITNMLISVLQKSLFFNFPFE